jgi:acyl-CoA dehydrogenase
MSVRNTYRSLNTDFRIGVPADAIYEAQLGQGADRWSQPPIVEHLKVRAKELGLWNMFLSKSHYAEGAGFTNLEYGLMAEHLGRSRTASEVKSQSNTLLISLQ